MRKGGATAMRKRSYGAGASREPAANENKASIKKGFGVLDAFAIVLIIVCLISVVARYVLTDEKGILHNEPEFSDVAVSILISDVMYTSADNFTEDMVFYLDGSADVVGKLDANFTVTPAQYYTENENGELVLAYHSEEGGNVDIRATLITEGYFSDGTYYLNGKTLLTSGMTITITDSGGTMKVSALVLDIALVS